MHSRGMGCIAVGEGTNFTEELEVGSFIHVAGQQRIVTVVDSTLQARVTAIMSVCCRLRPTPQSLSIKSSIQSSKLAIGCHCAKLAEAPS